MISESQPFVFTENMSISQPASSSIASKSRSQASLSPKESVTVRRDPCEGEMFTEQATRTNPATPLSGLVCVPAPTLPISHTTSITTLFYVLSFSPPFPSPIRQPRAAICHPISLYAIGILAALSAGACVPAGGIVYGWWTTGVTDVHSSESSKSQRSRDAGWVMAVVGVATLVLCWLFTVCCEWV